MAGLLPQLLVDEDRGAPLLVAAAGLGLAHRALEEAPHPLALRVPERRARRNVVEAIQVELDAEPAMVALLRLLAAPQELVQLVLARPHRAVDPLEHRPLLVAAPVRARDRQELEGPDPARPLDVWALAEIAELAVLVERDGRYGLAGSLRPGHEVIEDLDLEGLPAAFLDDAGVVQRELLPDEGMVRGNALAHPLLDGLEVVGCERPRQLEVVVEAVGDRRPDPELRAVEQVEDGLGHDVGRRVAHRIERVVGAGIEELVDRAALGRLEDFVLRLDHLCRRWCLLIRHWCLLPGIERPLVPTGREVEPPAVPPAFTIASRQCLVVRALSGRCNGRFRAGSPAAHGLVARSNALAGL